MADLNVSLKAGAGDLGTATTKATSGSVTLSNKDVLTLGKDGALKVYNASNVIAALGGSDALTVDGDVATTIKTVDLTAVTSAVEAKLSNAAAAEVWKFGSGNNVITADGTVKAAVSAGAGNDTLNISSATTTLDANLGAGNDSVSVAAAAKGEANITLGAGKDTLNITAADADNVAVNVKSSDLNRTEDVVITTATELNADGVIGALHIKDDNAKFYNVVVSVDGDAKTELYTATSNANNIAYTQQDNAAVIDVREAAGKSDVVLNSSKAVAATVSLGAANDTADSITVGKGAATVSGFAVADDTVVINGISSLKKLTAVSDATDTKLTADGYGELTLKDVDSSNQVELKISNGSGSAKVLVGATNLTNTETSQYYYSIGGDASLTLEYAANNTTLDLSNADKIKGIKDVVIGTAAGTAASATGLKIVGSDAANVIDVTTSTNGVVINGGKGNDTISLGAGVDTVEYTTNGGNDTINAFENAVAEKADVLKLTDVSKSTFVNSVKIDEGVVSIGTSTVKINGVNADNDVIKMQFSDGAEANVAASFNTASQIKLAAGTKVDLYNWNAAGTTVTVTAGDAKQGYSLLADKLTKEKVTVNASFVDGIVNVQGAASVDAGTAGSNIWAYGKNAESNINLAASTAAVDTVWFKDGVDKNVTVASYTYAAGSDTNDQVKLAGSNFTSYADLMKAYSFKADGVDMVITGANGSKLTLTDADAVKLVQGAADSYDLAAGSAVVKVGAKDTAVDFTNDAKVYAGMATLNTTADIITGTYAVRLGEAAGKFDNLAAFGAQYITDSVKNFDASASSGSTFMLAGAADANNTLTGGTNGKNYFYGGGASNDIMEGNTTSVDVFFYGKDDGNDTIRSLSKDDTINLYDVSLADYAAGTLSYNADKGTITVGDNRLTVDGGFADGMTVQLTSGSYTYNAEKKTFTAKA